MGIYDHTLSLILPLSSDSVISGEQRLELYQYILSVITRGIEGGVIDCTATLPETEGTDLAKLKQNLNLTFVNAQSETLTFYPNGVFILGNQIIDKINRVEMDSKIAEYFNPTI